MFDTSKELSHLTLRKTELLCQLEYIESILDEYEQLDQQRSRMGESSLFRLGIPLERVELFLAGDWMKQVALYKETYNQLYIIERRLFEIQKDSH